MELQRTLAKDLDKFIEDHLLPDGPFRERVNEAIHIICSFLKERCFLRGGGRPVRVLKVVKGGSSGKGTALRGRSDADLVVFLSTFGSFQEQFDHRKMFIQEIRRQLEACKREKVFHVQFEIQNQSHDTAMLQSHRWGNARVIQNPRSLSFTLSYGPSWSFPQNGVEFDVLPAFDVLGQVTKDYKPDPQIYVRLIQECERLGREGEFSTCFTELQRAFLKDRPAKLKSLIRLVKYWYQECKRELRQPLPPQYALELLTVYAWEQGSKEADFVTAEGFQTVLQLVVNYRNLCVYWTKYYDRNHPVIGPYLSRQLQKPRPVILDPADPTGNVGADNLPGGWERLAGKARVWLTYPCFKKGNGSPVGSWNIRI
ncbi:2'-5'-oligoadenylate synthetase 1 [Phyllostomus discolor]|uniref:2'-5' oligoadenylate synthase n=1 Tax=Phyllostomus discolor TaxID=89673 RepID=A0A6J2N2R1_9CHIR|nr:2'-5'-oligoadenylate synthase 1 [Phyllostomus discolor]KAF6082288.1 2'-5'-oligoadenylate synthetase 1 [Phyllostomus discolor]